jgi:hypothetical protein
VSIAAGRRTQSVASAVTGRRTESEESTVAETAAGRSQC